MLSEIGLNSARKELTHICEKQGINQKFLILNNGFEVIY